MKVLGLFLAFLGAIVVLVAMAPHAAATATCHASGNWCQGYAHVSTTTGGVSGARCFAVRTTNTAPTCSATTGITPTNEATWEMSAGACLTFRYFEVATGASPPATPNKLTFQVKADNTATVVRTYKSAAAPDASGTSYSFCATSDGTSGGSPRAGTYNVFVKAQKDDGAGGVGNYNVATDGSVGASSTALSFDNGALRGQMLVSALTRTAYPADSTFAYGTAGDESVTITGTFTQPNVDNNVETMRTGILDAATVLVGENGATVDVDSTSLAQAFVVDSTFPAASSPYVPVLQIIGNAGLTGVKWTNFAATGHGAGVTFLTGTGVEDGSFNIDPRIVFDSDGSGTFATADDTWPAYVGSTCTGSPVTVFNKGETFCSNGYVFNARGEKLTRAMTLGREDASATACVTATSSTPSGAGLYTRTATLSTGVGCTTAADTTGAPRYFRMTNTDQDHRSGSIFGVSSLYFIDAHVQLSSTLVHDDYPTEDSAEDTAFIISTAETDTMHGWCHVKNVRKDLDVDTSGSAVSWSYADPTPTTRFSGTTDTGSDGWTPTHLDYLASTPLGTWSWNCSVSFNGNSASDAQSFTISVPSVGGSSGDPMDTNCAGIIRPSASIRCTISLANSDGSARSGASTHLFVDVYDPSNTAATTGAATTEIGTTGVYRFTYSIGATPATGVWLVVGRTDDASPVTRGASVTVETDGTQALASSIATALSDLGLLKGYTDQVEGYTDTLEAGQSTINGNIAAAATTINGHTDTQAALILAAIEDHDDLMTAQHADLMTAIHSLNETIVGNFTFTDENVSLVYNLLLDKLGPQGESVQLESATLDFFAPIFLWITVFFICLRFRKLMSAGACTLGVIVSAFQLDYGWQAASIAVLGISLWLEALGQDHIIQEWFAGRAELGRRPPN